MNFLNSFWPILAPLLAVPLAIHLFNRKFPVRFPFPTLQYLKKATSERSRLFKWRHLILLALRTVVLLLILLAFLKPVRDLFDRQPGDATGRHVLILIDRSLSMEYRSGSMTSRDTAVQEAQRVVEQLRPADLVNLIEVGNRATVALPEFSSAHSEVIATLNRLGPSYGTGDFSRANGIAAEMLRKAGGVREVYYFSDFQRTNWSSAGFEALPPGVKLFFIDSGPRNRFNHAIVSATLPSGPALAGDVVMIDATIGNYSDGLLADRMKVFMDNVLLAEVDISIPAWNVQQVRVPVPAGSPGLHVCRLRIAEDSLAGDDTREVVVPVMEKEEVLILSDSPPDERRAAFYLQAAMNPFENEAGSLIGRPLPVSTLTASALLKTSKVFVTESGPFPNDKARLLADFILRGGSLVYFLDGKADATNLLALEAGLGAGSVPLRLAGKQGADNIPGGSQQIASGEFKSEFLRLFKGAQRQNLGLLNFHEYYQAMPSGTGKVLLSYADKTPAMASSATGLGRILLCNFSIDQLASNMTRQRIFPAWIQDLIKLLNDNSGAAREYRVGETVMLDVWKSELRDNPFTDPAGKRTEVKRDVEGERCHVSVPVSIPGVYSMGGSKKLYAFAAGTDPGESDLRPIEPGVLPSHIGEGQSAVTVEDSSDLDYLGRGKPLYHYFILAALFFLAAETVLFYLFKKGIA